MLTDIVDLVLEDGLGGVGLSLWPFDGRWLSFRSCLAVFGSNASGTVSVEQRNLNANRDQLKVYITPISARTAAISLIYLVFYITIWISALGHNLAKTSQHRSTSIHVLHAALTLSCNTHCSALLARIRKTEGLASFTVSAFPMIHTTIIPKQFPGATGGL